MEPKQKLAILQAWQTALQGRSFQIKIGITALLLILCAMLAPILFQFIQQRNGIILNDFVLSHLPHLDLSIFIFTILYGLIISSIVSLTANPYRFLLALQAYVLLTAFRFITPLLTPLEEPVNMVVLNDPFVQHFFYQQPISKDLFFSGHTSLLALLALCVINKKLFYGLLLGTIIIGFMLLLQHAHYTIDVLVAPVFAWLAFRSSKMITREPDQ